MQTRTRHNLNISVFGLGYVGCVSLGCLAHAGYNVIGVDINETKVQQIQNGVPTIFEPGLDELIHNAYLRGRITATSDVERAVTNSHISFVTVGTPSKADGELELSHIFKVSEEIGKIINKIGHYHTIAIRSTVKPGTCHKVMEIIAQHSGKRAGKHFSVIANPEFLREGTAIQDYINPPYVLIGSDDPCEADEFAAVYADVNAETLHVSLEAAEVIKYVNNSWHALKVAFGNEIGSICKALNIDSQEVMDIFVRDRVLNISPHYLRPGFAYGGSCLPKDLSALVALARANKISAPVIESIKESNDLHIKRAIDLVKNTKESKKLSFLGLTFKNATDDVRNSPILEIINVLDSEGYDIKIYDEVVNSALATGRNKDLLMSKLGTVATKLVATPKALLDHSKIIIVAKNDELCNNILCNSHGLTIVDLVCMGNALEGQNEYVGLAWGLNRACIGISKEQRRIAASGR